MYSKVHVIVAYQMAMAPTSAANRTLIIKLHRLPGRLQNLSPASNMNGSVHVWQCFSCIVGTPCASLDIALLYIVSPSKLSPRHLLVLAPQCLEIDWRFERYRVVNTASVS